MNFGCPRLPESELEQRQTAGGEGHPKLEDEHLTCGRRPTRSEVNESRVVESQLAIAATIVRTTRDA